MTSTPSATVTFAELLAGCAAHCTAVGAFNVVQLEHAEAIVAGAEQVQCPVILQISENCVRYHGGLEPIIVATRAIAQTSSVPALVHLDHITDPELMAAGIELGVDSIMYDGSALSDAENRAATAAWAARCAEAGIGIEAELGEVGGKDGVHAPGARTDPEEASVFVRDTGVDALAVAVGTSHAMTERVASVDRNLISRLHDHVGVPLVLHGSSGLSDAELQAAVAAGMTKVNISTHLNSLFTQAVRDRLAADAALTDPRKYIAAGRTAVADEVARLLLLLAGEPTQEQ